MPEHAHILLLPLRSDYRIATILKSVKQPVAQEAMAHLRTTESSWCERLKVTRSTGRVEYRFWQQGGGYDRNIHKAQTAWASVNYIHNNPVRRGLVDCPTDWAWSSARWYAGDHDMTLAMDGRPPDAAL